MAWRRGALVWTWALFPLLDSKLDWAIIAGHCQRALDPRLHVRPAGAFIADQFPTQVRYAGSSLAYTFAGVFAGGIAPLVFTALYRSYGKASVVALYVTVALFVTAAALYAARRKMGSDPIS